ncbi:uncharacterized protein G2W53_007429 [Senna tora]|uniref:Uncharacterized protein n=1 Tax=Senna tora TaxID=362788 RepID=A0A834X6Z2_9FABA|nr:uncharacterized protein G2W53_007429 [Senna tora]
MSPTKAPMNSQVHMPKPAKISNSNSNLNAKHVRVSGRFNEKKKGVNYRPDNISKQWARPNSSTKDRETNNGPLNIHDPGPS